MDSRAVPYRGTAHRIRRSVDGREWDGDDAGCFRRRRARGGTVRRTVIDGGGAIVPRIGGGVRRGGR